MVMVGIKEDIYCLFKPEKATPVTVVAQIENKCQIIKLLPAGVPNIGRQCSPRRH